MRCVGIVRCLILLPFMSEWSLPQQPATDALRSRNTWQKTLSLSGMGESIQRTSEGGFVVCGYTEVSDLDTDAYLVKFTGEGVLQWERRFGDFKHIDMCHHVDVTANGDIVTIGTKWVFGGGVQ